MSRSAARTRLQRAVVWSRLDTAGTESSTLSRDDGWVLAGTLVVLAGSTPVAASYSVACDARWRTRRVDVHASSPDGDRQIRLASDGQGRWTRNGRRCPDLDGCADVDLALTPSTNTLPIRRLGLAVGASSPVTAAWVRFPELAVEPLPQRYTRLDDRRYRYESRDGAFTAEVDVDDLGLVTAYGTFWKQVHAQDG
jgi:hypothetical protein